MSETFPVLSIILIGFGGLALGVTAILFTIYMGMWVYHDAKEKNMEHPALWVLLTVLVSNFIGLVIYLVVRSTQSKKRNCPECAFMVPEIQGFCPRCGAKQPPLPASIETNGKAKKNLRRMLISLGAFGLSLILFIVFYFVFIFQIVQHEGNFNQSLISGNSSYFGTMITSSSGRDSGDLSFSDLNGSYRIMSVRVTDGDTLTLSTEISAEEGTLRVELRGSNEVYPLEPGLSTIEGLGGNYSIYAVAGNAKNGSVYVQQVNP